MKFCIVVFFVYIYFGEEFLLPDVTFFSSPVDMGFKIVRYPLQKDPTGPRTGRSGSGDGSRRHDEYRGLETWYV